MGKRNDEMTRAIDTLARAMPNGQLMAAMGPLAFLGSAAEHIAGLEGSLHHLRGLLNRWLSQHRDGGDTDPCGVARELVAETRAVVEP